MKTFKTAKGTELPIMDIKGKDYLVVAQRIRWFREEHPDWSIETNAITITDSLAIMKCIIRDEKGLIISTAHKSTHKADMGDFIESSETGAIGRALAMCGYGTQFCGEELDEGKRLADSPIGKQAPVFPGTPMENDGVQVHPDAYIIPGHMGRLANKRPEDCDPELLKKEVERVIQKFKGKVPPPAAAKFVSYSLSVLTKSDPTAFDNFTPEPGALG